MSTSTSTPEQPIQHARRQLARGLELVVEGSSAWWRHASHRALRFSVDRRRAERILEVLSEEYYMRCPPGRRILTPEERLDRAIGEPVTRAMTVRLTKERYTIHQLAEATGLSHQVIHNHVRQLTARKEDPPDEARAHMRCYVIYADAHLAAFLEEKDYTGSIEHAGGRWAIDGRESVTLDQAAYDYSEMAELMDIRHRSVSNALRYAKHDYDLYLGVRPSERGRPHRIVYATEGLCRFLRERYAVDATLTDELREANPKAQAA